MEAMPFEMGLIARDWDEEHLNLQSASEQIRAAPTGGFTAAVAGEAARFTSAWGRHTTGLGEEAETTADGLRSTATDYLQTDGRAAENQMLLGAALREIR